jgi:malate dehydrogenase (oxaloacetate-decarboxylating)(NADP+)
MTWSDGTAIFASGSPFKSFTATIASNPPKTYHPNQGNNVYIFPGLGLGAILAKVSRITDDMVYTSAAALSACLNADELAHGLIYPRIERVREASVIVAREVMKCARRDGVDGLDEGLWRAWGDSKEGGLWAGGDGAMMGWIGRQVYDPSGRGEAKL